jgi:heme exporter protein A
VTPLLRFEGVALHRGGRLLFEDLSFELAAGDRLQVTGPNGSGKTSLLRLAAGLLRQEKGQVHRAKLALADDHLALDRELPLYRALRMWAADVGPAIEALGLAHLTEVPVRLLSSGQAKRATLARVAASGVPLWVLDEPFNALDSESSDRLQGLIDSHCAAGGAVLAASHLRLEPDCSRLELA